MHFMNGEFHRRPEKQRSALRFEFRFCSLPEEVLSPSQAIPFILESCLPGWKLTFHGRWQQLATFPVVFPINLLGKLREKIEKGDGHLETGCEKRLSSIQIMII